MAFKSVKIWLSCFVAPLFLDRVTKYFVVAYNIESYDITSFLEIYLTYNRGVSWGIGSSADMYQFTAITFLVSLVLAAFIYYMRFIKDTSLLVCASLMVASGAVSNLFDRLWYGGVVDFIRFYYETWSFPVFNLADVFISFGAAVLLFFHIRE